MGTFTSFCNCHECQDRIPLPNSSLLPYSRVSQEWHYWHFESDNSLLWGAVLCVVRCLAASMTSNHWMPIALSHPQLWQPKMSPDTAVTPGRQNHPQVENHWSKWRSQGWALKRNSTTNCPCQGPEQEWGQVPVAAGKGSRPRWEWGEQQWRLAWRGRTLMLTTKAPQPGWAGMRIWREMRGMPESEPLKTTSLLPQHWAHASERARCLSRKRHHHPKLEPRPPRWRLALCPILHVGFACTVSSTAHNHITSIVISVDKQGNQSPERPSDLSRTAQLASGRGRLPDSKVRVLHL